MIVVTNKDRALGYQNKLLWDLPGDLQHFKKITSGHVVVMGEKTFNSLGRALPKRINIVITNSPDFNDPGVVIAHSIEEAVEKANSLEKNGEWFVIGGGSIYAQMLKYVDKLYLTLIDDHPQDVDTFFPEYEQMFTREISREVASESGYKYDFVELVKN